MRNNSKKNKGVWSFTETGKQGSHLQLLWESLGKMEMGLRVICQGKKVP